MSLDLVLVLMTGSVLVLLIFLLRRGARETGGVDAQAVQAELRAFREEQSSRARELRDEIAQRQAQAQQPLTQSLQGLSDLSRIVQTEQAAQRELVQKGLQSVLESIRRHEQTLQQEQRSARDLLDSKLKQLQESNERKLDEMRATVDEKLQTALERRLTESFKLVSERLEAVQNGLGEMRNLATGVGDLKRVLTNVKERGTWGEYQLGAILEQILQPGQFERNVRPKGRGEVVEYAVRLPGRGTDSEAPVWLPIDAKFPKEDYERLVDASVRADQEALLQSTKALVARIRDCARDIREKYIEVPYTTDFGILFLPTEGLYAEILRQPGLHDELQQRYRVLVAGPTTLAAVLTSLRIGFQTLAIEKQAGEVWKVLGGVKEEFVRFGDALEKVKQQLNTALKGIEATEVRTRAMGRKLKSVEQLPEARADELFGAPEQEP